MCNVVTCIAIQSTLADLEKVEGRLSSFDVQTHLCTPHFLPQVGHQSLQPIIERYNSYIYTYWQLL